MRRSVGILILCGLAFGLLALAAAASETTGDGARELVSIQVRDADIQDVIQQAVAHTGCDVVIDGEVQGKITLDLTDVPVARVLDRVCLAKGYYWWQTADETYLVCNRPRPVQATATTSAAPPSLEPQKIHRLHTLRFTSPQFLSYLFGGSDDPGPMPTAGGLPMVGDAGRVGGFSGTWFAPGQLGGGLAGGGGGGGGGGLGGGLAGGGGGGGGGGLGGGFAGGGGGGGGGGPSTMASVSQGALIDLLPVGVDSIIAYPVLNQLIISGTEEGVNELIDIIKQLDRKPQQVIIEITSMVVNRSALKDFGIEWKYVASKGTSLENFGFQAGASVRLAYTGPDNFYAFLNWLVSNNKGRFVSSQSVRTMHLIPATNQSFTQVPLITVSTTTTGGLSPTVAQSVAVDYLPVQRAITVTPMIHPDGTITLSIPWQNSVISRFETVTLDGVGTLRYPEQQTDFVVSTANVRDGETIMIGGGVNNTMNEAVTEVPLLADIPLIGQFFKRRKVDITEQESLLFFTPRIVKEEAPAATLGPV